jgi:histidinol dehydrogenase
MWPWLGVDQLDPGSVKGWMLRSLERVHFYVPAGRHEILAELEVYVRARVGSVFEGAA